MLSVLRQFLSNRSQYVVEDGRWSKLVNLVSGVPREVVICSCLQLYLVYKLHRGAFLHSGRQSLQLY